LTLADSREYGAGMLALLIAIAQVAAAPTTIEVDATHPLGPLPADFVGLSFEMNELSMGRFDAKKGNLARLFANLGKSHLRIGGNTLDRDTLWVPAKEKPPEPLPAWVKNQVTPADIARLRDFLAATGWKSVVGINLAYWDARLAADQARTMVATLGPHLAAIMCGNEPNSWVRHGFRKAPFEYPQYKPDWEACVKVVGSNRIAAPDTSAPTKTVAFVAQLAREQKARMSLLTVHTYSVPATATGTELLSPKTNVSQLAAVAPHLATARAEHLPIRVDETNSAAGGGIEGVSDSYASALWALDYTLQLAREGFDGLNFHSGLGVCNAPLYNGRFQRYTPICAATPEDAAAQIYLATPEYYGLYVASQMGPGKFLPVKVASDRNVNAYAVRGDDHRLRIAVIAKEDTAAAAIPCEIKVETKARAGQLIRLTGHSLKEKSVALQGATFARDGRLPRLRPESAPVKDGRLSLELAAGTAVLVTLQE
jgi:hypothetical protein